MSKQSLAGDREGGESLFPRKPWSASDIATAIAMKGNGAQTKVIGAVLGRETVAVDAQIYRLRKLGLLPPAPKRTRLPAGVELSRVQQLRSEKLTYAQIAMVTGASLPSVWRALRRSGGAA